MKILHINYSDDQSGAYLAMWNLHQACLRQGFDSCVLLLNLKNAEKPGQYVYWDYIRENTFEKTALFLRRRTLYRKHSLEEARLNALGKPFHFYRSPYRIHRHPLVKQADIIHLHQVSGMLDWPSFFRHIKQKVLYTLHDCEPFSEGFHLETGISDADRAPYRHLLSEKQQVLSHVKKGTAIFPSQWHQQRAGLNGGVFHSWKQVCMPHIIHSAMLKPVPRNEAAEKLGLDPAQRYLAFVVSDLTRPGKGYDYLYSRRELIQQAGYRVIVTGRTGEAPLFENWHYTGLIHTAADLAAVYALATYTLQCSGEESFGLTVIESLLCGTPVISRPVGIANDKQLFTTGVYTANDTSNQSLDMLLKERLYSTEPEKNTLQEEEWNRPILEKLSSIYSPD